MLLLLLLFLSVHGVITSQKDGPRMESTSTCISTTTNSSNSLFQDAIDCDDIWNQGHTHNGIYRINPSPTCTSKSSFEVVCDQETSCGGWIVIQRRFNGSENFNRGWDDYKNGFGNFTGEHWLGLEKLHRLTANGDWTLRVELEDFHGNTSYAEYTNFSIGDESTYYIRTFGEYHGTAGDALMYRDVTFSTNDEDHDRSRDMKLCTAFSDCLVV